MTGARLNSRRSIAIDTLPSRGSEGPVPGLLEGIGARFRSEFDDSNRALDMRVFSEYQALQEALIDRGYDANEWKAGWSDYLDLTKSETERLIDTDKLWAVVQRERQRNQGAFGGLPATREEFEKSVLNRHGAAQADAQTAGRAGVAANLVGGMAAEVFNVMNYLPLPMVGGGKGFVRVALEQAVANAAIEVVQQPGIARARERRGETLTGDEIAMNIATAAAFGGALGIGAKAVGDNWGAIKALPKEAQERVWGKVAPYLPEKLRGTMEWDAISDNMLPDLAEGLIGRDNLTPDERTAIEAMRRDIEVRGLNPFVDDPAGSAAHIDALGETMARILAQPGSAPVPSAVAAPSTGTAPRLTPSALGGSSAIRSGTVDIGGRATLKRRIGIVESGGNNAAANPNSTAVGKYQFIKGTWTRLYKARYGSGGLSDAAIAAKRSDPRLQEILMDDLIDYNARVLARAGSNGSAGDLYLAHFAGAETAGRLLQADRNAPASSIFSAEAIAANKSVLAGKTVGEVIAWAHRKMGSDPGPVARGATPAFDPADPVAAIDAEIADIDRQLAELDAMDGGEASAIDAAPMIDPDAITPAPLDYSGEIPLPRVPAEPQGPPRGQVDEAVDRILPELKRISQNTRQSLNRIDALARQLDFTEEDVTRALQKLALYGGGGIVMTPSGKFRRMPVRTKPLSILEFVAAGGGLRDVRDPGLGGGESLATVFQTLVRRNTKDGAVTQTQPALIPGYGPLLRPGGKTLDEWGEALHEAGYIGRGEDDRPTVSDVLEALKEEFAGRKIYSRFDLGTIAELEEQAARKAAMGLRYEDDPDFASELSLDASFRGIGLRDEDYQPVYELFLATEGGDASARMALALDAHIAARLDEAVFDAMMEAQPDAARYFDEIEAVNERYPSSENPPDAGGRGPQGGGGPEYLGRDAGQADPRADAARQSGEVARGARDGYGITDDPGPLTANAYHAFDDADGPAPALVADSLDHDMRAVLDRGAEADPAAARRARQQAQLKADSPMRAAVDQDSTIGAPLFDAADQFRLDTGDDPRPVAEVLKAIDDEQAAIDTIRGCL